MATVHFLYRSVREKSCLEVRLQHTVRTAEKPINYLWNAKTQIEVSNDYWTKHHKTNSRNIDIKNEQKRVTDLCSTIENLILDKFKATTPEAITKDWLQSNIDLYYNPKLNDAPAEVIPTNLIEYFDYYIKYKENYPSKVLIRKYKVLQKKLARFQTERKKPILIKDVNKRFKLEFSDYCESQQYSRITIQRDFAEVKTLCIDARSKGIETSLELDKLSFPRLKATNIFLTFEELNKIEKIEKEKLTESLENAKDWLIISCYTGQRVSDFMRFTKEMIRIESGKKLIEFTQVKTKKIMTVPLHPKVIEILDKRNGMFPYAISSQKYNDYIKVVCEIAEITQTVAGSKLIETAPESGIFRKVSKEYRKCDLVSSHIGRRSFATNFYGTIPTTYLIYVTGHSTEVMFLNYIGKSNKDLALEMTNYF